LYEEFLFYFILNTLVALPSRFGTFHVEFLFLFLLFIFFPPKFYPGRNHEEIIIIKVFSPPPHLQKKYSNFFFIFTLQNNKGICPNSFVVTMQKFAKNKMTTPTIHWELKNSPKTK